MPARRRRIEQRTRTVRLEGREWVVAEQLVNGPNDDESALIFRSDGEMRRVLDYPWLWFALLDEELTALATPGAPPIRRVPKNAAVAIA
jgi:hypothetical protein